MSKFNCPDPARVENKEIAWLLRLVAAFYQTIKPNKFKAIAYSNAADEVEHLSLPVYHLWKQGRLDQLPYVGQAIRSHLEEYFKTGYSKHWDKMLKQLDPAVFYLIRIPGVGAKTAVRLTKRFNFPAGPADKVVKHLIRLTKQKKIRELEGFGVASEAKLAQQANLFLNQLISKRLLLSQALQAAWPLVEYLKKSQLVEQVEMVGSVRRRLATVGDVDLAVATREPLKVIDQLADYPMFVKYETKGETKARILVEGGLAIDVVTTDPSQYGSLLQHLTGSKFHNIALRQLALDKGLSLSEYGIKRLSDNKRFNFTNERDFYHFLGLDYIPPELRENKGEIEAAAKHQLPKLITHADIKGDLHLHSNFDTQTAHDLGRALILELAYQAKKMGYQYIAITNHNMTKTLTLSAKSALIDKQTKLINQATQQSGLKIFNSLEVDIDRDGRLALEEKLLNKLDFVVVGVHAVFGQDEERFSQRLLTALRWPKVKILAHPTTRLLNQRPALKANWARVFKYMAAHGQAVEINACPDRLDLPVDLIQLAVKIGVKLVINSDAHRLEDLKQLRFGVWQARRAWVRASQVINCLPLDKLVAFLT